MLSRVEQFVEKLLHSQPGALIGLGVVGDAFAVIVAVGRVAETMHCTAIHQQLPINAGPTHFLLECGDLISGRIGVVRSM